MRHFPFLILLAAIVFLAAPVLRADSGDPSDFYLNAYMTIEKAQKLEDLRLYAEALAKYKDAEAVLQKIRDKFPDWHPVTVADRLGKTSEAIASLQKKIAAGVRILDLDATNAAARKAEAEELAVKAVKAFTQDGNDDRDELRLELKHPLLVW